MSYADSFVEDVDQLNQEETAKTIKTKENQCSIEQNKKKEKEKDSKEKKEKREEKEKKEDKEDKEDKEKENKKKEDKNKGDKEETVKIGNLSLRSSQQPGHLVGLGNNIIDKGDLVISLQADVFVGNNTYRSDISPTLLYGITDNFSIYMNIPVPYSPGNKEGDEHSSGIEDMFLQFEYAFYERECKFFTEELTIIANVTFPTGSGLKFPPTGFQACSFLIGSAYDYLGVEWSFFGATAFVFPLKEDGVRFGNQYIYQLGFARNICSPPGWIYAWVMEFTGLYAWRNTFDNQVDPNSGGNVIWWTPSLWISSHHTIFQIGVGTPVVQHWFGDQEKEFLSFFVNFAYTF